MNLDKYREGVFYLAAFGLVIYAWAQWVFIYALASTVLLVAIGAVVYFGLQLDIEA